MNLGFIQPQIHISFNSLAGSKRIFYIQIAKIGRSSDVSLESYKV